LQPYVIRQGDYLLSLAYQFGFDADTVWNDPQNAQLRQAGHLSKDPNILYPTDMLYIPDQSAPPVMKSLAPGTTNTFVANIPTASVSIRFTDAPLASQAFTVPELPDLTGLTTGADGSVTLAIPVTLDTFTILFTQTGDAVTCNIGDLDPIDTLSGVFQRLQHLGYLADDATVDSVSIEDMRAALRAFKAAQPGGSSPAPIDPSPASTPSPPSNGSPPPSSGGASGGASSPAANATGQDNAGLNDGGTLDDETSKLLVAAHGC
jgi:hypothetical protein